MPSPEVTEDGRYLVITLFEGYEANGVLIQDLRKPASKPRPLFIAWDASTPSSGSKGDTLYFQTTNNAPRGRVIAVDANKPEPPAWRHVVPQTQDPINEAHFVGGRIVVEYTRDAHQRACKLFEASGSGSRRSKTARPRHRRRTSRAAAQIPKTFFSYSDYQAPTRILRLDVANNAVS